jgi:hypothetical protein
MLQRSFKAQKRLNIIQKCQDWRKANRLKSTQHEQCNAFQVQEKEFFHAFSRRNIRWIHVSSLIFLQRIQRVNKTATCLNIRCLFKHFFLSGLIFALNGGKKIILPTAIKRHTLSLNWTLAGLPWAYVTPCGPMLSPNDTYVRLMLGPFIAGPL